MTFSFLMEFTTEVDANKLQLSLACPARNRVSQALLLVQKENITFLAKSVFRFQPKYKMKFKKLPQSLPFTVYVFIIGRS